MENTKNSIVKIMAEIGIFAAIGFVLDEIQGALAISFTSGGSIGFAMIAVLIVAYRRGWIPGVITGLLMGILDFITKAYIVHFAQVFLDYIFPYALVGLAGLFKPLFDGSTSKKTKILFLIIGTVAASMLKFLSHYFAGLFFWNIAEDFAWNLNYMSPALYSFVYNIAYVGPSMILSLALLIAIYLRAPHVLTAEQAKFVHFKEKRSTEKVVNYTFVGAALVIGTILFVVFLIRYIYSKKEGSWEYYYWQEYYFKFNKDCMVASLTGLAMILIALNHLFMTRKGTIKYDLLALVCGLTLLILSGYNLSRIIKMYFDVFVEHDEGAILNNDYWILFVPTLSIGAMLITLSIYLRKNKSVNEEIISAN